MAHGGPAGEPPVHPQQQGEPTQEPQPCPCTSKQELGEFLPPSAHPNAEEQPRSLSGISCTPSRARVHGTNALPFQHLLPDQHSSSLCFSIKQTLPASSPAGPGNRAADLGHLGTVPALYLDFGAKFSICEILCKPRQRGHREVGAVPAGPAVLHHRHSLPSSTVSPSPKCSSPWSLFTAAKISPMPRCFARSSPREAMAAQMDTAAHTARPGELDTEPLSPPVARGEQIL